MNGNQSEKPQYVQKIMEQMQIRKQFFEQNPQLQNERTLSKQFKENCQQNKRVPVHTISENLQYLNNIFHKTRVNNLALTGNQRWKGRDESNLTPHLNVVTSGESSPCDSDQEDQIRSNKHVLTYEECCNVILDSSLIKSEICQPTKVQKSGVSEDWVGIREIIIFNIDRQKSKVNNKQDFEYFIKNSITPNYGYKGRYSAFIKFDDENSAQFSHYNIQTKLQHYANNLGEHIQIYRVKENKSRNPPKSTWMGVIIRNLSMAIQKNHIIAILDSVNIVYNHIEDLSQIGLYQYTLVVVNDIENAEKIIKSLDLLGQQNNKIPPKGSIHNLSAKVWKNKNGQYSQFFQEVQCSNTVLFLKQLRNYRKEQDKIRKQIEIQKQQELEQKQQEYEKKQQELKIMEEEEKKLKLKQQNQNLESYLTEKSKLKNKQLQEEDNEEEGEISIEQENLQKQDSGRKNKRQSKFSSIQNSYNNNKNNNNNFMDDQDNYQLDFKRSNSNNIKSEKYIRESKFQNDINKYEQNKNKYIQNEDAQIVNYSNSKIGNYNNNSRSRSRSNSKNRGRSMQDQFNRDKRGGFSKKNYYYENNKQDQFYSKQKHNNFQNKQYNQKSPSPYRSRYNNNYNNFNIQESNSVTKYNNNQYSNEKGYKNQYSNDKGYQKDNKIGNKFSFNEERPYYKGNYNKNQFQDN